MVPANVAFPTDSGLLAKAVRRIGTTAKRIRAAGGATRTTLRTAPARRASARTRSRPSCGRVRRSRDQTKAAVLKSTRELAGLAEAAAGEAERLLANARQAVRRAKAKAAELAARGAHDAAAGRAEAGWCARSTTWPNCDRDAADRRADPPTGARHTPDAASRLVSLHDGDARPIAKGRLGKPVEFGQKAQVVDNDDGIVLDHSVEQGNPPDAPQLAPAVKRVIKRAGRTPRSVTADRGYGEAKVDQQLTELGVKHVVIPRKGKPSQARRAKEHRRAFRRTIKWRTGSEGRISYLKRGYGWDRTRIDGLAGTRIWTGHGILAHNLVKISALAA